MPAMLWIRETAKEGGKRIGLQSWFLHEASVTPDEAFTKTVKPASWKGDTHENEFMSGW